MTALESSTKVQLGGTRGGPDKPTLRQDRWWIQPVVTVSILTAFVIYSTWAAFQNKYYFVGANVHRDLIQPFYSPCIGGTLRARGQVRLHLERLDALAGAADPDLPSGLSTDLLLLPTQLLPRVLVVTAQLAPWPTPTARTPGRRDSRSSCRTRTATSSTPDSSSTSCSPTTPFWPFTSPASAGA